MSAYTKTAREQLTVYDTHPDTGLSTEQVPELRARFGKNALREVKRRSLLRKFLAQLADVMVLILLAAAAVSFVVALIGGEGEFIDSIIILGIVLLNGVLGVAQESKAERSLDALKDLSAPHAKVKRDGQVAVIPAAELVPGDLILLEAGDFVPADARLLEAASLQCEESSLTGESLPVQKDAGALLDQDAALGDRINMVYSGCAVTYGRASAVVCATGMDTEIGKIARLLEEEKAEITPLQKRLAQMGGYLGILALAICAVIFVVGLLRGLPAMQMFMTAVSLAVAAIPEGLTAVVTVVLALGVQRMVDHNAIIRRLPAVETLGSASVICSDKTGTLTQNRMTVRKLYAVGAKMQDLGDELGEQALHLLRLGALCSDGRMEMNGDESIPIGDPTETAIVAAALENGMKKPTLEVEFPRVAELPFDSDRKMMTTVHQAGDRYVAITKGGLDVILPLCKNADLARARMLNEAMGEQALRVLAIACRELDAVPERPDSAELERDLTFMGLIGMIDPPREESARAVETCNQAGIRTVMITGDHAVTAGAIAGELGILREGERTISGAELTQLSDGELAKQIRDFSVYARVSPEDKIRIVKAWQAQGEVVAMTGDGVNDAPALRAADIGCAMGVTGTDVAKGAADMVLTDDNFSTIVEAVRQGRGIYDNIKKTVQFLLGCNLGEVFTVFFAILFGWGTPLLAIHLLLINVVTDALPALALGLEPIDRDIMRRKPLPRDQGIFADRLGWIIALQGLVVGILTLTGYWVGMNITISSFVPPSYEVGMTMAFLVLCLSQLSQALNCRSRHSLFSIGFLSNKRIVQALLISALIPVLICLVPPLEAVFKLTDLSMLHWMLVLGLAVLPLILTEAVKGIAQLRRRAG